MNQKHPPAIYYIVLLLFVIISCKSDKNTKEKVNFTKTNPKISQNTPEIAENPLRMEINPKGILKIGDKIDINIVKKDTIQVDSANLFINSKYEQNINSFPCNIKWNSENAKTGINKITTNIYQKGKHLSKTQQVVLSSDIVPPILNYKIINTYKHDINAYTQGLFYHNNFLYEATGIKGESSVRKVKPETGEIMYSHNIPSNIFGEGITLNNDKIVQISWRANTGFVYDINTFEELKRFNYPSEGWGICLIDNKLYMSDGTSTIHILENENYTQVDQIEVYDNNGPVKYLNELEYINGFIYANIYMTEKIARINPQNGKIVAYINFSGLLKAEDKHPNLDVLNGIAYDKKTNRIFVTGKRWPKIFEIQIIE